MSYIEQNLVPGESIVYRGYLHWCIFIWPTIWIMLGFFIASRGDSGGVLGSAIAILGLVLLIAAWLRRASAEFALTDRRIFMKVGILRHRSIELQLGKIESLAAKQGIVARMLDYGSIVIVGTGGTREPFNDIGNPQAFRQQVQMRLMPA